MQLNCAEGLHCIIVDSIHLSQISCLNAYNYTDNAGVEVQYALPTKHREVPVSELYSTVSKPKVHCHRSIWDLWRVY